MRPWILIKPSVLTDFPKEKEGQSLVTADTGSSGFSLGINWHSGGGSLLLLFRDGNSESHVASRDTWPGGFGVPCCCSPVGFNWHPAGRVAQSLLGSGGNPDSSISRLPLIHTRGMSGCTRWSWKSRLLCDLRWHCWSEVHITGWWEFKTRLSTQPSQIQPWQGCWDSWWGWKSSFHSAFTSMGGLGTTGFPAVFG